MTREEAIYQIKQLSVLSTDKEIPKITEALDMAIEALQRQTDGDLISRADAMRIVHSAIEAEIPFAIVADLIKGLPSAEAAHKPDYSYEADMVRRLKESPSAELPKGDLISRADAVAYPLGFDHYDKENGSREFICGVESYREYIQHLPSVSAERVGEWQYEKMVMPLSNHTKDSYRCSVCHTHWDCETNYCPNCGATMQVPIQEVEIKNWQIDEPTDDWKPRIIGNVEVVVRCKDCEYYKCCEVFNPKKITENDFCSWAKMKGGAK